MNSNKWKYEKDKAVTDGGMLLRKTRIIMPANVQNKCITIAHEGHQGTTKTKSLLKSKIWFPKMDEKIEHYIKSCL